MNSRLFRFDFDRTHFGDHGLESSTISCPADTLYSALCVEALRMGGQQLLGELVACSTLRLTDLLPYVGPDYLVPKPLHSVRSDGSSMQKKLAKKIGVRMVAEIRGQHDSEWAAISEVARLLGVGCAETVRKWVRQAQVDAGARPGTTTEESAELKRLRRDNAELRRANAILKTASAFFAAELDRPAR